MPGYHAVAAGGAVHVVPDRVVDGAGERDLRFDVGDPGGEGGEGVDVALGAVQGVDEPAAFYP